MLTIRQRQCRDSRISLKLNNLLAAKELARWEILKVSYGQFSTVCRTQITSQNSHLCTENMSERDNPGQYRFHCTNEPTFFVPLCVVTQTIYTYIVSQSVLKYYCIICAEMACIHTNCIAMHAWGCYERHVQTINLMAMRTKIIPIVLYGTQLYYKLS